MSDINHQDSSTKKLFKPVSSRVNFPAMETDIQSFWKTNDIFRKSEFTDSDRPLFVLYEGPPTANGSPGLHHVLARAFKDIMPRYKTMKGFKSIRKGGWDTHGLPVELEVEKELGISTKGEIEAYGVEAFNAKCRESVFRYVKDWEDLTDRIGFWVDMDNPYATLNNEYIETCWWLVKQFWEKNLVYRDYKVTPHCPRCVTSLSSHEVSLGYQEDTPDPSVYIKFKMAQEEDEPEASESAYTYLRELATQYPVYFLAWTTTPWTLPGNTGLAVSNDSNYSAVLVRTDSNEEIIVMASSLLEKVMDSDYQILNNFLGSELYDIRYEPLYNPEQYGIEIRSLKENQTANTQEFRPRIINASFVSMEDGTGIVHIAPAFGEVDLDIGSQEGLFFVQHVDSKGEILGNYEFAGKFVKDADKDITRDLDTRGLLHRNEIYKHTYPFCWRCDTPLLYYAKSSWYIRTTSLKDELLSGNQEINWYPDYIKNGRFGEWLRNNVDWAISRERYWGTPIPIWQCESCSEYTCIGTTDDIRQLSNTDDLPSDLHRPYIDNVILECQSCKKDMYRVPEVMDVWFDSGAMPFAQWHITSQEQLNDLISDGKFPASYICEAVDQTRGWFYSLHAISTLLTGGNSYENVICLGLIQDEKGAKMSKSKGNVIQPWEVINTHGADALRWYLFTAAPPGNNRRFSSQLVGETLRHFFLTLWNTYSFFITYANIDDFNPTLSKDVKITAEMDRWILSELNILIMQVTELLEEYNPTEAGRRIQEFVDTLSNWYVRRSRRRFWKSENDQDKISAYNTLYDCLVTVAKLMAPFAPFISESIYQNLVVSCDLNAPESVHLSDYPICNESLIDQDLSKAIRLAMQISSLGRSSRSKSGIKVRQPLARILVKLKDEEESSFLKLVSDQILDELNVKEIVEIHSEDKVLDFTLSINPAVAGSKYGSQLSEINNLISRLDQNQTALKAKAGFKIIIDEYEIEPDELNLNYTDKDGYTSASDSGYLVAIDKDLTDELKDEGIVREIIHRLQNMRRSAGFDIADHINTKYNTDERISKAISNFQSYIRQETLSDHIEISDPTTSEYFEEHNIDGVVLKIGIDLVK